MKNRLQSLTLALGVALGLITWGGLLQAQQTPAQSQPSMPESQPAPQAQTPDQTPSTQAPTSQSPSSQTPSGESPSTQSPSSQTPQTQTPSGQTRSDQTGSQAQSPDAAGTQTFTGTVVKQGNKYVLQDAASGTSYDIDHQDEVAKFEGKKVRVHGTLDASGKMIHVQ